MNNKCIFNNNKVCDDCGQCDVCDLDAKKTCNNCGKCLQMEGVDIRAVKIDEISEIEEERDELNIKTASDLLGEITGGASEDYDDSYFQEHSKDFAENDEVWELIDDIDGLTDVIEESDRNDVAQELYPGLIYIKK